MEKNPLGKSSGFFPVTNNQYSSWNEIKIVHMALNPVINLYKINHQLPPATTHAVSKSDSIAAENEKPSDIII